jgi:hypothetical protein
LNPKRHRASLRAASSTSEFTESNTQRVEFERFREFARNPGNARNLERGGSGGRAWRRAGRDVEGLWSWIDRAGIGAVGPRDA